MEKLRIKRFSQQIPLPTRTYPSDAGLDFYSPGDYFIPHGSHILIPSGIGIALQIGTVGLFLDRSSIGSKGIKTLGGVIDANYRGEIFIGLANIACYDGFEIKRGDKIAQMIIVPIYTPQIEEVDIFEETDRAHRGFGSSGR